MSSRNPWRTMAWSSAMKTRITIAPPPSAPPAAGSPTTLFRHPVVHELHLTGARGHALANADEPEAARPLVHRQADAVVADGEVERAVALDEPHVHLLAPWRGATTLVSASCTMRKATVETSGGRSAMASACRRQRTSERCSVWRMSHSMPACRPSSSRSCGRSSVTRLRVVVCVRLSSAVISSRLLPIDLGSLREALRRERQRQVQRGQLLAELVVQLAGDARALVLARALEVIGQVAQIARLLAHAALERLVEVGQLRRGALELRATDRTTGA